MGVQETSTTQSSQGGKIANSGTKQGAKRGGAQADDSQAESGASNNPGKSASSVPVSGLQSDAARSESSEVDSLKHRSIEGMQELVRLL